MNLAVSRKIFIAHSSKFDLNISFSLGAFKGTNVRIKTFSEPRTHKVVETLIRSIKALPDRDFPPASDLQDCIVKSLAEENGFSALKAPEEFAIFEAMKNLRVGPRTAHYGWRLYKRYRTTGDWDAGAVSY